MSDSDFDSVALCNGICLTPAELGVIASGVIAHPDCPVHGAAPDDTPDAEQRSVIANLEARECDLADTFGPQWRLVVAVIRRADDPPCNPHPDAPHGFDRNGSHNADCYVCDCEGWTPPEETAVCSNHYCQHAPLTHHLPGGACDQRRCGCSGYSTDPPTPGRYAPPSTPGVRFVTVLTDDEAVRESAWEAAWEAYAAYAAGGGVCGVCGAVFGVGVGTGGGVGLRHRRSHRPARVDIRTGRRLGRKT